MLIFSPVVWFTHMASGRGSPFLSFFFFPRTPQSGAVLADRRVSFSFPVSLISAKHRNPGESQGHFDGLAHLPVREKWDVCLGPQSE